MSHSFHSFLDFSLPNMSDACSPISDSVALEYSQKKNMQPKMKFLYANDHSYLDKPTTTTTTKKFTGFMFSFHAYFYLTLFFFQVS